jgi:hypothetical protein
MRGEVSMLMDGRFDVEGEVAWWHLRGNRVISHGRKKNLVVSLSRRVVGNLIRNDPTGSGVNAIAIGLGTAAPTIDDVKLGDERYRMAMVAAGIDTPINANLITPSGPVTITFRRALSPYDGSTGVINTLDGGFPSNIQVTEFGLFGQISTLSAPSSNPTLGTTASGAISNLGYSVKTTWVNSNGESSASTSSLPLTTNKFFTITINAPIPPQATQAKIYVSPGGGSFFYHDVINLTPSTVSPIVYTISSQPPATATPEPVSNTSTPPGISKSGLLFNRALIGPVFMKSPDRIMIENILYLGGGVLFLSTCMRLYEAMQSLWC